MRREPVSGAVPGANFIGCWALENDGLCDRLIDYFERNAGVQKPGLVGAGVVDTSLKQSHDIMVTPHLVQGMFSEVAGDKCHLGGRRIHRRVFHARGPVKVPGEIQEPLGIPGVIVRRSHLNIKIISDGHEQPSSPAFDAQ